jgi:hypothetical protein
VLRSGFIGNHDPRGFSDLVLPETVERLKQEVLSQAADSIGESTSERISREELRARFFADLPADLFRFCLDDLVQERKMISGKTRSLLWARSSSTPVTSTCDN